MKNLKLGVKLIGGFIMVALIALTIGSFGLFGIMEITDNLEGIGHVNLPSIQSLLVISEAQTAVDAGENGLLSEPADAKTRQAQYQRFDDAKKRADEAWKVYEPLPRIAYRAQKVGPRPTAGNSPEGGESFKEL